MIRKNEMLKNFSPQFLAFLQATGLAIYIILIALFFNFVAPNIFDGADEFYAPIIMLLLLVISATVSGLLVLGRAGVLFWEKKYKESFTLVGWTIGWGIFYFVLFLVISLPQ